MVQVSTRIRHKAKSSSHSRDRFTDTNVPWIDRWDAGKELRQQVPREKHAGWNAPKNRPDPIDLLIKSNETRLPDLVLLRQVNVMSFCRQTEQRPNI